MQHHIAPLRSTIFLGALVACAFIAAPQASAQQTAAAHPALKVEGNKKLQSQAKITADSAAAIAVAKMPGTSASSAKIEHHDKTLVYTVSLLKPGSKGVDRVWVDATTGSNALSQAREFHQAIGLTGLIVTKLDGSGKGGIVIAIQDELGLPTRFVGTGEKLEDLTPFDGRDFIANMV